MLWDGNIMKYLSVCSGIEAATVAWHPMGWTPAAFSENLDRLVNLDCGFADRAKVGFLQSSGMDKAMAVRAKDDAVGKRVRAAFAALNDVVGIARRFIPSAAHALVGKHPAQRPHPTTSIGVDIALGEHVGLPLIPRNDAGTVSPVLGERVHGTGLASVMAFYESARPSFLVHCRHFSQTAAFAKPHEDDKPLPILMALKVFSLFSIGRNSRNDRSATTLANLVIHKFSLLIG